LEKAWAGRFSKDTDPAVDRFQASIGFDRRLWPYDIQGSIAHACMLGKIGVLTREEVTQIVDGLRHIGRDIAAGRIDFDPTAEDIHMNIEKLLIERIGDIGRKLHTARSRNDQVALDTRLYLKHNIRETLLALWRLQEALLKQADRHRDTVMPGYTHLQPAQPVVLAHHLLAYYEMLRRDGDRFLGCLQRVDVCPLGAGALAGVTFSIDRRYVARQLGFSDITPNSIDSVSDRDYLIEFCSAAAILMMHLSRLCEELVLWSSPAFGFVEMDDAYTTGSSIMPQKKNPDVAELVRGKSGRVYGHLVGLLTMMKGLPLAYNKDMQEDKEALFDTVDTIRSCLDLLAAVVDTTTFRARAMEKAASFGHLAATDLADYLVRKGVPFRQAHRLVGTLVRQAAERSRELHEMTLEEIQGVLPQADEEILALLSPGACIAARDHEGGTGPNSVKAQLERARREQEEMRAQVEQIRVPGEEILATRRS